jgi:hypothetical protein
LREVEHRLLELVLWLQHPRSVGVDNLVVGRVDDAHDAMACGLRLRCDDGDAFADEVVHQSRFADVRVADDVDKACFVVFVDDVELGVNHFVDLFGRASLLGEAYRVGDVVDSFHICFVSNG